MIVLKAFAAMTLAFVITMLVICVSVILSSKNFNKDKKMKCNNTLCRHNGVTEKICCCKNPETDRLSKHILELQADKGRLTDEVDTLKLQISELIKQRQYWKDSSYDWRHKFFKKGLVKRLVAKDKQLTEAKSLLAKWVELYKPKSNTVLPTPIQVATEQFLKEQTNENN